MDSRGLKYPSVTEVISPYINKDWFTDESRDRGSAVHAAISAHLQGLYMLQLAPDHQPYFDSARRWIDLAVDKVILVEERLEDPEMGYCGKPDLVCKIKGSASYVLPDFKTAQAKYKWWEIQGAAYRHLVITNKEIWVLSSMSVRAKKDGSGCLIDEHSGNRVADFNIFTGLLNAHKFFSK